MEVASNSRSTFAFSGGGGGIRTPETLTGLTVFKTAGFNHSPTPPPSSIARQARAAAFTSGSGGLWRDFGAWSISPLFRSNGKAWRLRLRLHSQLLGCRPRRFRRGAIYLTSQIKNQWSHLERLLLVFGHSTDGIGLNQGQPVTSRINFNSSANRQRGCDIHCWLQFKRLPRLRRTSRSAGHNSVAKMRAHKVGDIFGTFS